MSYRSSIFLSAFEGIKGALLNLEKDFPKLKNYNTEKIFDHLSSPPKFEWGQVAFPCFSLCPFMKLSPDKIANKIKEKIPLQDTSLIEKCMNVSGYLNFYIHFPSLAKKIFKELKNGTFFNVPKQKTESLLIEFSQPNTHKSLHVGHLRNLVLGEALCRLKEQRGDKVTRVTYPGDFGTHVLKVLWYLIQEPSLKNSISSKEHPQNKKTKLHISSERIHKIAEKSGTWLGEQYSKVTEILNEIKDSRSKTKYEEEMNQILSQLQSQKGSIYELYKKTREISLQHIKEVYDWFGTYFEKWYYESEVDQASVEFIQKKYKENILVKSQGAIGIDLSKDNLGFVLLLKTNGQGLYLTKDVELLRRKFRDYNIDRSLVIVDLRQKLHFEQLFHLSEIFKIAPKEKSEHLLYESVVDEKSQPISSRKKSGMEIGQLRQKMLTLVQNLYLSRYEKKWENQELQEISNKIVISALKYGMLRVDPNMVVKFSLDQWLKLEGETGPYVEYVYTRCQSLLRKAQESQKGSKNSKVVSSEKDLKKEKGENRDLDFSFSDIFTNIERQLLFLIFKFKEKLASSEQHNKPNILTHYLFELSQVFNRFYTKCPVLKVEDTKIQQTRVYLVSATAQVIKKGLELLGIPAVKKM